MLRRPALVPALVAALATAPLTAQDHGLIGPAALGMGVPRVASVDDSLAIAINPAALGFMGRSASTAHDARDLGGMQFGVGLLDARVGVALHGRLGDYVERLDGLDLNRLENLGVGSQPSDLRALIEVTSLLRTFDVRQDVITVDGSVGLLNARAWHLGIGLRGRMHGVLAITDLDLTNLGIDLNGQGGIATAINNVNSGMPAGYTPQVFSAGQQSTLQSVLGGGAAGAQALARLDHAAGQAGLSASELSAIVGTISDPGLLTAILSLAANGGGTLGSNTTAVSGRVLAYAEVPLAFGWAVTDWLSVGGAVKLMLGRNGAVKVRLTNGTDAIGDYLDDAQAASIKSAAIGVDIGLLARWRGFQVGLVGRDLNTPTFDGGTQRDSRGQSFTIGEAKVEPRVTAAIAAFPWSWLTIEGSIDLTATPGVLRSYQSRHAGLGAHVEILRVLELRAGVSRNLAEDDIGTLVHAGIGLDLWGIRADLAGAVAVETATVDGSEVPRQAELAFGLACEF